MKRRSDEQGGEMGAVSRGEALRMISERKPTEGELRALRRMELANRYFLLRYDEQPRWAWSPPTSRMADEVRAVVALLDTSRRERGAPPVVAPPPPEEPDEEGGPEEGDWGGEDGEYGDEAEYGEDEGYGGEGYDDEGDGDDAADDKGSDEDSPPGDEG